MKKVCKHALTPVLAIVLVSVLTLTAFAASWSNSGVFRGTNYEGKYSASIDLAADTASVTLNVSDFVGAIVEESGVSVEATIYYTYGSASGNSTHLYTAGNSTSHTWTLNKPLQESVLTKIDCKFYYMGHLITSATVTRN